MARCRGDGTKYRECDRTWSTTIAGVGELVWLADPDGNVVGAMRYDPGAE